jgi:hypothetical protein
MLMPTVTTIASFPLTLNSPVGSLFMDSSGNLLGGDAFEISDSGFATAPTLTPVSSSILWQNISGQAAFWFLEGNTLTGGGPATPNPGTNFRAVGTGDFYHNNDTDILWQNTNTG